MHNSIHFIYFKLSTVDVPNNPRRQQNVLQMEEKMNVRRIETVKNKANCAVKMCVQEYAKRESKVSISLTLWCSVLSRFGSIFQNLEHFSKIYNASLFLVFNL